MDGDLEITLADAIIALQVLVNADRTAAGLRPDYLLSGADANGNQRIDPADALSILQQAAGLRLTSVANTVAGGEPGPVSGGDKPDALPDFASLLLYSAQSPLNASIGGNPSIDPNNEQLIDSLVAGGDFLITVRKFSSPVYFVSETTPT